MVDVARRCATYAEYVAIANDSDVKYDYFAGEVVAMAGGTVEHGRPGSIGSRSLLRIAAFHRFASMSCSLSASAASRSIDVAKTAGGNWTSM